MRGSVAGIEEDYGRGRAGGVIRSAGVRASEASEGGPRSEDPNRSGR
jgi:hypothetical protein